MDDTKAKLIKGIAWGFTIAFVLFVVWAFATYGIDPNHQYFHFFK